MKRYEPLTTIDGKPLIFDSPVGKYVLYSDFEKLVEDLINAKDELEETGLSLDGHDLRISIDIALTHLVLALRKAHPQPNPADRGEG